MEYNEVNRYLLRVFAEVLHLFPFLMLIFMPYAVS